MDDTEFAEWVRANQGRLTRSAYLLTGDVQRAEDLAQEAMVKVGLRWNRLRHAHPTAHARTIIVRDNVSWWRRRRHETTVADVADTSAVATPVETHLLVRQALGLLTARQRAVLVLRYFDDLTERETADALGVAVGTVKSTHAAALARLRRSAPELEHLLGDLR